MGAVKIGRAIGFCAILGLVGCAQSVWAPDDAVKQAIWSSGNPPSLTLVTVVSVDRGNGGHSALLVDGSQRALFDPAGTFSLPFVPERNDVHFGMTDRAWSVYIDYHARETWNVRLQKIPVTAEQAEDALSLIQSHGPVPKAHCNVAVTRVLSQVSGFESIPRGFLPNRTADWFAALPGVGETLITDDDADDNHGVLFRASGS